MKGKNGRKKINTKRYIHLYIVIIYKYIIIIIIIIIIINLC